MSCISTLDPSKNSSAVFDKVDRSAVFAITEPTLRRCGLGFPTGPPGSLSLRFSLLPGDAAESNGHVSSGWLGEPTTSNATFRCDAARHLIMK